MSRQKRSKKLIKLGIALSTISLSIGQNKPAQALVFNFDYSYDTNGFFSGPDGAIRKNTLELAADYYESLGDSLSAINASGGNTWTPTFTHPGDGTLNYTEASLTNLNIAADTLVVFVGGRDLSSGIGLGGPGGFSWSGSASFGDIVEARGQTGALDSPATDFGPWGGSLSFDNDNTVTWNSDGGTPTTGENDFLSVAIHELGHLLGYGSADSWDNLVDGSNFTGATSVDVYNNFLTSATSVPLDDNAHWANNLNSLSGIPEPALDPSLTVGTRKLLTDLDYAGLADIGWETSAAVPFEFSPGLGIFLMSGLFGVKQACKKIKHREQLN